MYVSDGNIQNLSDELLLACVSPPCKEVTPAQTASTLRLGNHLFLTWS